MKKFAVIALLCAGHLASAHSIRTAYDYNREIFESLQQAGFHEDGATGTIFIRADQLVCEMGSFTGQASCKGKDNNSKITMTEPLSHRLYNALEASGLRSDGAAGHIYFTLEQITCRNFFEIGGNRTGYACTALVEL